MEALCVRMYIVRLCLLEFVPPQSSVNGLGNREWTQQKTNNRSAEDRIKSMDSLELEDWGPQTSLHRIFRTVYSRVIDVVFILMNWRWQQWNENLRKFWFLLRVLEQALTDERRLIRKPCACRWYDKPPESDSCRHRLKSEGRPRQRNDFGV